MAAERSEFCRFLTSFGMTAFLAVPDARENNALWVGGDSFSGFEGVGCAAHNAAGIAGAFSCGVEAFYVGGLEGIGVSEDS